MRAMPYLSGLSLALLEDLLNDIVIDRGAELVLKGGLGSGVEGSLNSLTVDILASMHRLGLCLCRKQLTRVSRRS